MAENAAQAPDWFANKWLNVCKCHLSRSLQIVVVVALHSATRGVKWLHLSAHKVSQMLNLCVLCITIRSLPVALAVALALLPFA